MYEKTKPLSKKTKSLCKTTKPRYGKDVEGGKYIRDIDGMADYRC